MAATASSRAHLIHQLNTRRTSNNNPSSPGYEEYATATSASSFDAGRDAIHSTAQMPDYTTQQPLPGQHPAAAYDQYPDNASEGSAEMSIELGRGAKRSTRAMDADVSDPHIVFSMGNGSLYSLVGSPPFGPQKKMQASLHQKAEESGSRRQPSAPSVKRTASTKQPRSLSDALHQARVEDYEESFLAEEGNTGTFNARNTRFSRSRQTSAALPQQPTPRRAALNNPTAQSNSFMLPDLPNITELVSGTRKDGTPLFARTTKPSQSRSRFTSGTFTNKQLKPEHVPVDAVPVPADEKAIYTSLQILRERVAQLEFEKSETAKRTEEYETNIIELRAQLAAVQDRPDSGLGSSAGSDAEGAGAGGNRGSVKLQASVKSLQGQLGRSERKTSVAEITLQRVTKERDELITQIGVAYYNNEELKAENDAFNGQMKEVATENEELKAEVDALRQENQDLRVLIAQTRASYEDDATRRSVQQARQTQKRTTTTGTGLDDQEIRDAARLVLEQTPRRASQPQEKIRSKKSAISDQTGQATHSSHGIGKFSGEATSDDLAIRIAQEVRKNRDAANGIEQGSSQRKIRNISRSTTGAATAGTRQRPRSKSQTRNSAAHKGNTNTLEEQDMSDAESTTQLDFGSLRNHKRGTTPTPMVSSRGKPAEDENSRDLTYLTWQNETRLNGLRRTIEEERIANKFRGARAASAPSGRIAGDAVAMMSGGLGRKSSMKNVTVASEKQDATITGGSGLDEFGRIAKNVRVQSPHSSFDAMPHQQQPGPVDQPTGDLSILSNTSRRRRRAASAEGMTSAFILPDITLSGQIAETKISHDAGNCTACPPGAKEVTIPTPIPVTDRPEDIPVDVTSATIRPSQPPPVALATVIKQLEDEIKHLKLQLATQQRLYSQHDPALSKRRRVKVKDLMEQLTKEIEKRSDQVYFLYDVLEGQKAAAAAGEDVHDTGVEETLQSLGIDPAELSGRVGRSAGAVGVPFGLDGASDVSEDLPFEGFSDIGEESEEDTRCERRRSREF